MGHRRRSLPDIAIVENQSEINAINECMTLLEFDSLIKTEDVVVITPNWVKKQKAYSVGLPMGKL